MFIDYLKIKTSLKEPWHTIVSQMTQGNLNWGRLNLRPPQLGTWEFLQLTLFLDASAINFWILRAFACSLIEYQKQPRHKNNLFLGQLNLVLNNPSQEQDISFLIEQVWSVCLGFVLCCCCSCCLQVLYPMFYNGGIRRRDPGALHSHS